LYSETTGESDTMPMVLMPVNCAVVCPAFQDSFIREVGFVSFPRSTCQSAHQNNGAKLYKAIAAGVWIRAGITTGAQWHPSQSHRLQYSPQSSLVCPPPKENTCTSCQ
jgi:hypothetical protein